MPIKFGFPKRHASQAEFYRRVRSDKYKWHVALCGRGWGKDVVLSELALAWLLDPGVNKIGWFTHSYGDAMKNIEQFMMYLAPAIQNFDIYRSSPYRIVHRPSGNSIKFYSFERPDLIRGKNYFSRVIMNEACLLPNTDWVTAVQPVCNFAKTVIVSGTPQVGSWVRQFFDEGLTDNNRVSTFNRTSFDNPLINPLEIAAARRSMSDAQFRQEYMAEWVADGDVFSGLQNMFVLPTFAPHSNRTVYGVDIGIKNDYTVVIGMNKSGEVVYFDRFRGLQGDDLLTRIMAPGHSHPGIFVIDETGIGLDIAYRAMLMANKIAQCAVIKYNINGKTKQDLIQSLLFYVNGGLLKAPFEGDGMPEFREEMRNFKVYLTRVGAPEYRAPNGQHDDAVMALGLCISGLKLIQQ